ncbi:hypothetical protein Cgig2_003773 [Carnegiea gigantea]|uniref:Uncharacterized protein n=1 Tax=Carnegiea gigantea TaxID=171969 RepID=A0A9Q1GNT2_9CARY|nr:hypothetical protein Cgig2_003773 [Carnegiea gigantea]
MRFEINVLTQIPEAYPWRLRGSRVEKATTHGFDTETTRCKETNNDPSGCDTFAPIIRDKTKSRNIEVNFLVINVPLAYNVIIGQPILQKVKAIIAPYLFQIQCEADDGSIGKLFDPHPQEPRIETDLIGVFDRATNTIVVLDVLGPRLKLPLVLLKLQRGILTTLVARAVDLSHLVLGSNLFGLQLDVQVLQVTVKLSYALCSLSSASPSGVCTWLQNPRSSFGPPTGCALSSPDKRRQALSSKL